MKKLLLIAAMLTLLTGCTAINSKYTGRSRMRIYNDAARYRHFSVPVQYHVVYYYPFYCLM